MTCKCGNKVDRQEPLKVQCLICHQFSHSSCYDIQEAEFELIKLHFNCQPCLTSRRRSLSESSTVFARNVVPSGSNVNAQVASAATIVAGSDDASDSNAKLPKSAVTKCNDKPVVVAPNATNLNNSSKATNVSGVVAANNATVFVNNVQKALDNVMRELISLRESNKSLSKEVSLLRKDNINLHDKVNELVHVIKGAAEKKLNSIAKKPVSNNLMLLSSPDGTANSLANKLVSADTENALPNKPVPNTPRPTLIEKNKKLSFSALADSTPANDATHVIKASSVVVDKILSSAPIDLTHSNEKVNTSPSYASIVRADDDNAEWVSTNARKSTKRVSQPVIGARVCDELSICDKLKWLHISSFKNNVEPEDIVSYLSKITNITIDHFVCRKLIKKDAVVANLRYVNFKLRVSECYYERIFKADIWPAKIKIRAFDFLGKNLASVPQLNTI